MHHDHVRGVEISIEVNGVALPEYEDPDAAEEDDGGTINTTRFVEIVPGSTFSIRSRLHTNFIHGGDTSRCNIIVDGTKLDKSYFSPHGRLPSSFVVHGPMKSNLLQRFQFSEFKTHDIPATGDPAKFKQFGTIVVQLVRCVHGGPSLSNGAKKDAIDSKNPVGFAPVGGDVVPEKMLKGRAISSRTTLAAAEIHKPRKHSSHEFPYGKEPFAIFTFKYRTRNDLKRQGVLPPSPSEIPLEQRDRATLNADELRQLLARSEKEVEDLLRIKKKKRERAPDAQSDHDCAVVEERSKRQRIAPGSNIQVVDLTDD